MHEQLVHYKEKGKLEIASYDPFKDLINWQFASSCHFGNKNIYVAFLKWKIMAVIYFICCLEMRALHCNIHTGMSSMLVCYHCCSLVSADVWPMCLDRRSFVSGGVSGSDGGGSDAHSAGLVEAETGEVSAVQRHSTMPWRRGRWELLLLFRATIQKQHVNKTGIAII